VPPTNTIADIIDLDRYPIADPAFRDACRARFEAEGLLRMPGFMRDAAVRAVRDEGEANRDLVYAKAEWHTVYLSAPDPRYPDDHPRNRLVVSSKGCLTDDQIPAKSPLRRLYDDATFRAFLCAVLGEAELHPYADPLSSINLHFAERGQELGWHFDNSSFAITLMIQPPEKGGDFEYIDGFRDADAGDMNFDGVADVLDGRATGKQLVMPPGALLLFKGRDAIHRVAPNEGDRTRMLAVLAYNSEPGVSLSETARMTFFGRVG
jgi:hypothetical protein